MLLFGYAALRLDLAELSEGAFELASEALAVDADVGECPVVLAEGLGHGESRFDLRMVDVDVILHFGDAERVEIGLDRRGAVDLPGCVAERLDELGLGGALGPVFIEERLAMALVGSEVLCGQDDGLTSLVHGAKRSA